MRFCRIGAHWNASLLLIVLLCCSCQQKQSASSMSSDRARVFFSQVFRSAWRFVAAKDTLLEYELQVADGSRLGGQFALGGVRVFSQDGVLLGTTSFDSGRLRFELKNEDDKIFLSPDPTYTEQLLLAGGWFKLSESADPAQEAGQLKILLTKLESVDLDMASEPADRADRQVQEAGASSSRPLKEDALTKSGPSLGSWSEENIGADAAPVSWAAPSTEQAPGQSALGGHFQMGKQLQSEQNKESGPQVTTELQGLGALRNNDENAWKSLPALADAFGRSVQKAATELQDETKQPFNAVHTPEQRGDNALSNEKLSEQQDPLEFKQRLQRGIAQERDLESQGAKNNLAPEADVSLSDSAQEALAEAKTASQSDAALPRALSRLESDPAFRAIPLKMRSYYFQTFNRSRATPLSGVRVFGVSTSKYFELELGQSDENGNLKIKLPSAMRFELLRADSVLYGARIVPLMASSVEKPQEIGFGIGQKDLTAVEKTVSLSAMYPSFGLWRFFSGGQLKQQVKSKGAKETLGGGIQADLAGSLSLFSLKAAGVGGNAHEVALGADAVPSFEHSQMLEENILTKLDLNASSHIYLRYFSRQPLKPRVAILYESDSVLPLLDESLVQRFKRSVQAYFVTEKKFIPVLDQSLKDHAGISEEALLAGWDGTHVDALLDLICVIKASQRGLGLSWKNRKGTELNRAFIPYSTEMPPELFAQRVYRLALDHFPDELVVSAQWDPASKSFGSLNIETNPAAMISQLSSGDVVEVKTFVQGALLSFGTAAVERLEQKQQQTLNFVRVSPAFRNAAAAALSSLPQETAQQREGGGISESGKPRVQLLLTRLQPAHSPEGLALGNTRGE